MSLRIRLSEPTEQIAEGLMNQKASPTATIKSLKLHPSVFENDDLRDLTPEEMDQVAFDEPEIRLRGYGDEVRHRAPDGKRFTVRDLIAAIEATELKTRHQSEWFEGIDTHHTFFEGIRQQEDGSWKIRWGS
ncbi:hypothetical protein [Chondromyces apiculatus]|uniref:Uncharacterized protein n=1 Tax=Chondromyces apiculatus DSM 436 TaxID=1192034 RepID=A0A017TEN3_9BACT|nr:hypothetical protein [Chondromyces apiculatus]EYF07290.1 Hypothetical protein CAP_0769 [Chondromyces apiculatus DSM 436]